MAHSELAYIEVGGRRIAYRLRTGQEPTIVFLPGYGSDMEGSKAMALDGLARQRGLTMLRLDYSGTGSSSGHFEEGRLDRWLEEALAAINELTQGSVILIGSSMGGWIALHLALLRPERIKALIGIAAAPDFTDWGFPDHLKQRLGQGETLRRQSPYGGEQVTAAGFWTSGQELLLLNSEISVECPVRLIHGEKDADVPLDIAFRTMRALRSSDVQLTVLKGGGHRLSEPHEIEAILRTVVNLLEPAP